MQTILVVDDDADIRRAFRRALGSDSLSVSEAGSGEEAITAIARSRPDVVFMDIRLGSENGLDLLRKLRELDPKLLVIIMTAFGTTQTAIEAMKRGAYDYVLKPFDLPKLKTLLQNALKAAHDMRQVVSYQPLLDREAHEEGIVGKSAAMQEVFKLIGQVSQSTATVLITGESGTGKELVARAIYHHSPRATAPFIAINCAAIPEQLLESELFGHEKGAFTGATDKRIGKFEQCNQGTIFLDEIGDMPPATQTKILRILQNGEFQRVGGNDTHHVDVRVLAATNRDPERLVAEGGFREDLYYRLNVVHIHLPPLRDRPEDLPVLIDYFLKKTPIERIASEVMDFLTRYQWPGNIRELENVIERAAVLARGGSIVLDDLPLNLRKRQGTGLSVAPDELATAIDEAVGTLYDMARRDPQLKIMAAVERELISRALSETKGNQVQAAKLLGITRATLRKRIEKFGIQRRLQIE